MIPITKPEIGPEESAAAAAVIESGWLAQGPRVVEFEEALADRVGARFGVGTSSGTAALHLCLVALEVGAGDDVLVPSLSFIATANAVRYTGARPVFVDVDPRTYNIDPRSLERAVTPRARAVIPVHQLGHPAELGPIKEIARRRGLFVVEDAACALGARYRDRHVGGSGDLCCFSFHPRKIITTGEGGMITCGDERVAARLRTLRSQGMSAMPHLSHGARHVSLESFEVLGYNYRLTDIQAAVGVEQLRRLPALLDRRRRLAERYGRLLAARSELALPAVPGEEGSRHAFQSYMIVLDDGVSVADVMQRMLDRGVSTRPSVTAIHRQPLYRSAGDVDLPATDRIARQGLMLPLYPSLKESEQDQVAEALFAALG